MPASPSFPTMTSSGVGPSRRRSGSNASLRHGTDLMGKIKLVYLFIYLFIYKGTACYLLDMNTSHPSCRLRNAIPRRHFLPGIKVARKIFEAFPKIDTFRFPCAIRKNNTAWLFLWHRGRGGKIVQPFVSLFLPPSLAHTAESTRSDDSILAFSPAPPPPFPSFLQPENKNLFLCTFSTPSRFTLSSSSAEKKIFKAFASIRHKKGHRQFSFRQI